MSDLPRDEPVPAPDFEAYQVLFDHAADPIVWVEVATDRILHANRAMERLAGRPRGELIGRTLALLHPPAARESLDALRGQVEATGTGEVDTLLLAADGGEIPVRLTASIATVGGRIVAQGIFRDLTAQRRMEEELFRAKKLESVGVLAGGIAHDFNNVLTSITGNLALARLYTERDGRAQEPIARAERAAHRAKEIIRQLLTFSRGEAPRREPTDLVALAREAVELLPEQARAKTTLHDPGAPLFARADRSRIAQMLSNLLVNADQATAACGRVELLFDRLDLADGNAFLLPRGAYARIRVADDGRGIPPETIGRIFDPYFSTKPMGSGLGLAIAHSVAAEHGGLVTVDSPPGEGTVFHVLLPRVEGDGQTR